jgi:hypothetical protein
MIALSCNGGAINNGASAMQYDAHVTAYWAFIYARTIASFPVYDWREDFPEMAKALGC